MSWAERIRGWFGLDAGSGHVMLPDDAVPGFTAQLERAHGLWFELGADERAQAEVDMAGRVPPVVSKAASVGTLTIRGILAPSVPPMVRFAGIQATATPDIAAGLKALERDEEVRRIHMDIDSPGGFLPGIPALAESIRALRQTKHVTAHVRSQGASAAFWLAAQADRVTAEPDSKVGSIGVYSVLTDTSAALAEAGVKKILVTSKGAKFKGASEPGIAITDEHKALAQKTANRFGEMFVQAVAAGRQREAARVQAEWATGDVWIGADAVDAGLVDSIEQSFKAIHYEGHDDKDEKGLVGADVKITITDPEVTLGQERDSMDVKAYLDTLSDEERAAFESHFKQPVSPAEPAQKDLEEMARLRAEVETLKANAEIAELKAWAEANCAFLPSGKSHEDLAKMARSWKASLSPEQYGELRGMLSGISKAFEGHALMAVHGTYGKTDENPDSPMAELVKLQSDYQGKGMSEADAFEKACDDRPDLYEAAKAARPIVQHEA